MSSATTTIRPRSTRTAVTGLVLAGLGVLAIIAIRPDDVGFALVVGSLLLLSAALVWRFGKPAHIWATVLGLLLLLMFGSYAVAGLSGGGELPIILGDLVITIAGAVTVYGAVSYLAGRRGGAA